MAKFEQYLRENACDCKKNAPRLILKLNVYVELSIKALNSTEGILDVRLKDSSFDQKYRRALQLETSNR